MALSLHGREIASVFQLLGRREVDLTAALGFALSRDTDLCDALLAAVGIGGSGFDVALEARSEGGADRTDIELSNDMSVVIIEAKRGWVVPGPAQLSTYAPRSPDVLVVVTDYTDSFARSLGLPETVAGIPVVHLSWRRVLALVRSAAKPGRRWTRELLIYLEDTVATLQDRESNRVFCVVLGQIVGLPGTHGRTYLDRGYYFHPQGHGYPKRPPTYMGFRWQNKLHTVRHVDSYDAVGSLREAVAIC